MKMEKLMIPQLGEIDFDSAEIMNSLELFFHVRDIPEKLQNQIIAQMLESPKQHTKRMHEVISACYGDISKADLQFVPQLYVCVREDSVQCSLIVYLKDADGELCCGLDLPVKLAEYKMQLAAGISEVIASRILES